MAASRLFDPARCRSSLRSAALSVPILIYLLIAPAGPLAAGWAVPIATDTAFAVAIIVLLGARVSVELRVFLTAAVIIDDLVAIGIIAAFYTEAIHTNYLIASVAVTLLLVAMNRWGIYRPLPYAVLGIVLWVCLHDAGLHATLAGVILALVTPARAPAKLHVLMAQADAILRSETRRRGEALMRHGPSEPAMRAFDAIHDRIESPTDKLLRSVEPWSSYVVLPIFALANAGVIMSLERRSNARKSDAGDHSGIGHRQAGRDLGGIVARRSFPHRDETPGVFLASAWRRWRACGHRLHDVALYRRRGVPEPGGFRSREDRHLHRIAHRRSCWHRHPVAEARNRRTTER